MKHNHAMFESALAAAIGDEPTLALNLVAIFRSSVAVQRSALASSRSASQWIESAARLEGLAASFGALDLLAAARAARAGKPGDTSALAAIDVALANC